MESCSGFHYLNPRRFVRYYRVGFSGPAPVRSCQAAARCPPWTSTARGTFPAEVRKSTMSRGINIVWALRGVGGNRFGKQLGAYKPCYWRCNEQPENARWNMIGFPQHVHRRTSLPSAKCTFQWEAGSLPAYRAYRPAIASFKSCCDNLGNR